jgi:hypothetical protein
MVAGELVNVFEWVTGTETIPVRPAKASWPPPDGPKSKVGFPLLPVGEATLRELVAEFKL